MNRDRLYLKDIAQLTDIRYDSLRSMRSRGMLPEPDGFDSTGQAGKPKPFWLEATILAWRVSVGPGPNYRQRWQRIGVSAPKLGGSIP